MTTRKEPFVMLSRTLSKTVAALVLIACTLFVVPAAMAATTDAPTSDYGIWVDPNGVASR